MTPNPKEGVNAYNPQTQEVEAGVESFGSTWETGGSESCRMKDTKDIVELGWVRVPSIMLKRG